MAASRERRIEQHTEVVHERLMADGRLASGRSCSCPDPAANRPRCRLRSQSKRLSRSKRPGSRHRRRMSCRRHEQADPTEQGGSLPGLRRSRDPGLAGSRDVRSSVTRRAPSSSRTRSAHGRARRLTRDRCPRHRIAAIRSWSRPRHPGSSNRRTRQSRTHRAPGPCQSHRRASRSRRHRTDGRPRSHPRSCPVRRRRRSCRCLRDRRSTSLPPRPTMTSCPEVP